MNTVIRIEGSVARGRQRGRTLGFPTANLRPERVEGEGPDGVYGSHPTLPGGGRSFEAHIFHYDGDLYGRHAAVETVESIRPEIRFPSPEALAAQLEKDRERCLALLHMDTPPGIG